MNYDELFAYVKTALEAYDHHGGVSKNRIKYSRFEHTERVYRWAMILAEDLESIGYPAERTAFVCELIARHSDKGCL